MPEKLRDPFKNSWIKQFTAIVKLEKSFWESKTKAWKGLQYYDVLLLVAPANMPTAWGSFSAKVWIKMFIRRLRSSHNCYFPPLHQLLLLQNRLPTPDLEHTKFVKLGAVALCNIFKEPWKDKLNLQGSKPFFETFKVKASWKLKEK